MGLLTIGTALSWEETKKFVDEVRKLGIEQLLGIWRKYKDNDREVLLWGDEIEYLVVSYDEKNKNARLSLRQEELLATLTNVELLRKHAAELQEGMQNGIVQPLPNYHPEFGRFMLEATPGAPYGGSWSSLLQVEKNMRLRRLLARQYMAPHETPITMPSFPRLGSKGIFTDPYYPPIGSKLRSQFLPDELISLHTRFPTMAVNIRDRRGAKVAINVPIFYDKNTPRPFNDPTIDFDRRLYSEDDDVRNGAAKEGHIYMDAMGFGMGCCCLQITFQAKNIFEARTLYDQLAPLGPVMAALTAAAPIFKGFLADVDVRWNTISEAVDDRTEEERGIKPLKYNRFRIPKSRYDTISTYIADDPRLRPEYNDLDLVIDKDVKQTLLENGMDERLASHFAHLFIRDPLVVFKETLERPPDGLTDHFENIQSSNWQHMRFKPPPPGNNIGWRVEFRSMEVQFTDFENAAYAIFIVLLTRVILSYELNFYIPISKVDENMATAHARDAINTAKFWFRKNLLPPSGSSAGSSRCTTPLIKPDEEFALFTINEIINGSEQPDGEGFIGLIPLIEGYLNVVNIDVETRCQLSEYLSLVAKRASGQLWTGAKWIREFVIGHEDYKKDSVVSQRINYDLVKAVERLGIGGGWNQGKNNEKNCGWEDMSNIEMLLGKYAKRKV